MSKSHYYVCDGCDEKIEPRKHPEYFWIEPLGEPEETLIKTGFVQVDRWVETHDFERLDFHSVECFARFIEKMREEAK